MTSRHERTILMPHEYLERYERFMRGRGRSPRTIHQRCRMAGKILEQWPDPGEATATGIVEWLGMTTGLSGWTRATYYSDAKGFFIWLMLADLIHENPMTVVGMKRPKAGTKIPKPLTAAEQARALAAAHGHMRAYLLLALRAGLRASEVAAFRGEEIGEDYIVLVGKGEGDHESSIPTHAELWVLAQQYPRRGWWFPSPAHGGHISGDSVTILVGRHFRRPDVDIPKGSIHRARHSFGTDLLRSAKDLRQVQEAMRHASPATTAMYTAIDQDELRAAINMLGPVA